MGKRQMHRHLVSVKVCVECARWHRRDFDRFAFYQHRLKSLDGQAMQGRSAIQQHQLVLNRVLESLPDFRNFLLYEMVGTADVVRQAVDDEVIYNKRLEKLKRHVFWQSAL